MKDVNVFDGSQPSQAIANSSTYKSGRLILIPTTKSCIAIDVSRLSRTVSFFRTQVIIGPGSLRFGFLQVSLVYLSGLYSFKGVGCGQESRQGIASLINLVFCNRTSYPILLAYAGLRGRHQNSRFSDSFSVIARSIEGSSVYPITK